MASIKEGANVRDVANQEYPRDGTPPMHILNLPSDILFGIFDSLEDNKSIVWRDDADLKTIQNARLVCSLFNRHASPLLCPVLTVQLDQASLDVVDKISRNPLIAAGIRHINVALRYRPKELADDLLWYKNQRQEDLGEWINGCIWNIESHYYRGESDEDNETVSKDHLDVHDEDDETVSEDDVRMYEDAHRTYCAIIEAWDYCFLWPDVAAMDGDTLKYRQVLWRGHEEYRRKHDEQFRLIIDGSFVDILASAISRMRYSISLQFEDKTSSDSDLDRYSDPTLVSTYPENLSRFMVSSSDWQTIEGIEGGAELLPARILFELPIAIHKAGATTSVMEFHRIPNINNYSTVSPGLPNNSPAWSDLRAACQHLTEFELRSGHQPKLYHNLLPEVQAPMYEYLSAILSGPNIEVLHLSLCPFKLNEDGRSEAHDLYRMGTILATANWPRIKRIWISNVSLLHSELESFCRGLDGSRMESLHFRDMELLGGGWAVVLDILRERLSSRCLDGKCKVYFADLEGGEFGKKIKERDIYGYAKISDEESAAQDYVSGVGLLNPFTNRARDKQWVNPAQN
ncbi:hypothetical protein VE03_05445 [Pseudogymnoascus sp. 23342-1-I1]|nr:hypothetical protein VE03_05445 [Pseudogymnoascus sp. 23342-1-I1]